MDELIKMELIKLSILEEIINSQNETIEKLKQINNTLNKYENTTQ